MPASTSEFTQQIRIIMPMPVISRTLGVLIFLLTTLSATLNAQTTGEAVFDSNLPIIKINTDGKEIPDIPKITATLQIIDNTGTRNTYNDPANGYQGRIGIELRGSSSQMFPKKSYTIETRDTKDQDTSVVLLGLPKESDWVLYAPYSDKTLIRNVLSYNLENKILGYSPHTRYCELFVNDTYNGVYVLVEKIKRNKNRVNISKLEATDISGDALTGGYIIQIDRWTSDSFQSQYLSNGKTINFAYVYPKPADITQEQKNYISSYTNTIENSIHSTDYTGYGKYIDIPSFVDFFLIAEFTKNVDAYRLSTYMYKDKDSNGGKFKMGPLWDFDFTYGNANYYNGDYTSGWMFNNVPSYDDFQTPFWWDKLLQEKDFQNKVKCKWTQLRSTKLNIDSVYSTIDEQVKLINEAQIRNFETFPILGQYIWPNSYLNTSTMYMDEISYMKNWIKERLTWLDINMPGTCDETGINQQIAGITISPNPFSVLAEFTVMHQVQGRIEINIFNITGQKITSLHGISNADGSAKIQWKGITDSGLPVNSGIYIYTIGINNTMVASGKIIKTE